MVGGSDRTVGEAAPATPLQPSADEVRAQLERLVASPDLDVPGRARKFLRYIVEETLAGRADRIKAYAIGTEVFGRDPSFDAQSDPAVRIEAGRLRRALEHYYLAGGLPDPVIITIPKGAYVPHFAKRRTEAAEPLATAESIIVSSPVRSPSRRQRALWLGVGAAALVASVVGLALWGTSQDVTWPVVQAPAPLPPGGPTLVVMPFTNLGELAEAKIYADGLTEEILSQLARSTSAARTALRLAGWSVGTAPGAGLRRRGCPEHRRRTAAWVSSRARHKSGVARSEPTRRSSSCMTSPSRATTSRSDMAGRLRRSRGTGARVGAVAGGLYLKRSSVSEGVRGIPKIWGRPEERTMLS
jgi:hypothetical protein